MEDEKLLFKIFDQSKFKKYMETQKDGMINLEDLVIEADNELIQEGYEPFQRPLNACSKIAKRLGLFFSIVGENDPFVEAIHKIYEKLYRKSDLYMPPMHIGTFAFKDTFLPLRILVIYGQVEINPMQGMKDVPESVLKWLFYKDKDAYALYDQWVDLCDFVYGLDEISKLKNQSPQAIEFWQLAKQQLEGAAATLLGSIDKYTVIQNSVIAIELLLKGALLAHGLTEKEVKNYSHDMKSLVDKVCEIIPTADHARLKMAVYRMPKLVERRYQFKDYKRIELGQIMMDAQYVAGEVLRQYSTRNIRLTLAGELENGRDYKVRHYPALS